METHELSQAKGPKGLRLYTSRKNSRRRRNRGSKRECRQKRNQQTIKFAAGSKPHRAKKASKRKNKISVSREKMKNKIREHLNITKPVNKATKRQAWRVQTVSTRVHTFKNNSS